MRYRSSDSATRRDVCLVGGWESPVVRRTVTWSILGHLVSACDVFHLTRRLSGFVYSADADADFVYSADSV